MYFETIRANDVMNYIGRPKILVIDLRDKEDFIQGHIPTAVNIPYDKLEKERHKLGHNNMLIFYCDRGHTSLMAARDLMKYGYQIKNVHGGIREYRGRLVRG